MAKKNEPKPITPTYNEAIQVVFKEILKAVTLDDLKFVENLESDELRDFCKFCSEVNNNPFFKLIMANFVHKQVMITADAGTNSEQYWGGKMMCAGIFTVQDFFKLYAGRWEREYAPAKEPFDPHAAFNKAKI